MQENARAGKVEAVDRVRKLWWELFLWSAENAGKGDGERGDEQHCA